MQRLLIVAPFPPEGGGGGGVILRSLLNNYPAPFLSWFTLSPDKTCAERSWRNDIRNGGFNWRVPGRRFKPVRQIGRLGLDRAEAILAGRAAAKYALRLQPDLCWFIVTFWSLPAFRIVRDSIPCGYHLSVHDDPLVAVTLEGRKPDPEDERIFSTIIGGARSVDCISERLRQRYLTRYQKDSLVVTRGFERQANANPLRSTLEKNLPIRIVLAGWGDCPAPWPDDFLTAIRLGREEYDLQVVSFDPLMGGGLPYVQHPPRLEQTEFDKYLQGLDIGYACDPLTAAGREFAATSFSTKVVTYIGNGLPFVYHGPVDSVIGDLVQNYKCGVVVEAHEPARILSAFKTVISDYRNLQQECFRARNELFDADRVRAGLFDYMAHCGAAACPANS